MKMLNVRHRAIVLGLATGSLSMGLFAGTSGAAVIAQYTASAPAGSTDAFAPSTLASGVTATDITAANPNVTVPIESNGYPTSPEYRFIPNTNTATATDATSAVANSAYISFTLTPGSGEALNLTDLQLDVARGGNATPRGIVLQSSADNFASNLYSSDINTVRTTYTHVTVDLTGAQYQNLTAPITFREYGYSPTIGQSLDTDNITVDGAVTSVPEPASLGLLTLAGGLLAARRRKA